MTGRLSTPVCELLECDVPVVSAGMGGPARAELTAAVSEAGGYGLLGMVREDPVFIGEQIAETRARTNRAFGVNLIPAATETGLLRRELDACVKAGVHSLCFFWDVTWEARNAVAAAKEAGCRVIYQVGNVADAVAAERAGADIVVAQGVEAGGHVHGRTSLLSLLPDVVGAVSVPVLAAGGITSGGGLVAALALGGHGVMCGTAFLVAEESFAHETHKRRVVEAGPEETLYTDLFAVNWPPSSPVRVLPNLLTERHEDHLLGNRPDDLPGEVAPVATTDGQPILRFSTDSPLRSTEGALDELALFAGQGAGMIGRVEPAATILRRVVHEAESILARLGGGGP